MKKEGKREKEKMGTGEINRSVDFVSNDQKETERR